MYRRRYKYNEFEKPTEFEVQALAYWNLKQVYPKTRGEYMFDKPLVGRRGARFDIAIFNVFEEMKLIIEVKKTSYSGSTTQGERYAEITGVPCIYIRGMKQAKNAVEIVDKYLKENGIEIIV